MYDPKPLASQCLAIASRAAAEYLRVSTRTADPTALASAVKCHAIAAVPAAMADAKDALQCGMVDVAEATFDLQGQDAARIKVRTILSRPGFTGGAILLSGPSSSGKTSLAHLIASELGVCRFYGPGPSVLSAMLKRRGGNVRELITDALELGEVF